MANELPNAVKLMNDGPFRDWMRAALVYQSREVIMEDTATANHDARLRLASVLAVNPNTHLDMFVNAIAADPSVAGIGVTVGTTAGTVTQPLMLQKVAGVWTPMALLLYPATP